MERETNSTFVSVPASIIIGSVIIAVAILISSGVVDLKGGGLRKGNTAQNQITASAAPQVAAVDDTQPSGPVKVSLDDDPVLGDKNAPVTLVEYSDYECPFCKRHFTQTHSELVKNYIDTGKVKLVFKDLPLSFHQNAHKEAEAANCAKEQGGDVAYYKFHDEMFTKTTSNGTGLSIEELPTLAQNVGLNGNQLKSCLDSGKYKDEVDKDLADATKYGANATPTFFVGKSDQSGTIEGTQLVGAQPYSAFQTAIDQLLK